MRRSAIIGGAAACGAGTFLWTLVTRMPKEEPLVMPTGAGRAIGPMGAMGIRWPRNLAGLSAWIAENPLEYAAWFDLAELRHYAGDAAGAREAWEKVAELAMNRVGDPMEGLRALFMRGWASEKLDRSADAHSAYYKLIERSVERQAELAQSPRYWHRLGLAYQRVGRPDEATTAWERAVGIVRTHGLGDGERTLLLARDLTLLGRSDEALGVLEREAPALDPGVLEHDELLAPLRSDPRYAQILRRAGTLPRIVTGG